MVAALPNYPAARLEIRFGSVPVGLAVRFGWRLDRDSGPVGIVAGVPVTFNAVVPDALGRAVITVGVVIADHVGGATAAFFCARRLHALRPPVVLARLDGALLVVGVYRVLIIEEGEAIEVLDEVTDALSAASISIDDVAVITGLCALLDAVAAAVEDRLCLTARGGIADA